MALANRKPRPPVLAPLHNEKRGFLVGRIRLRFYADAAWFYLIPRWDTFSAPVEVTPATVATPRC